jgi:hypothetical protein
MADSKDSLDHEVAEYSRLQLEEAAVPFGFCRDGYTNILEWERARQLRDEASQLEREQRHKEEAEEEMRKKEEDERKKEEDEREKIRRTDELEKERRLRIFRKIEGRRAEREKGRMWCEDVRERWDGSIFEMLEREDKNEQKRKRDEQHNIGSDD